MFETIVNSPMFGLSLCVGVYLLSKWIQRKTKWAIANPVLLGAAFVIAVLSIFKLDYEQFNIGAKVINWMLGPVTALLALGIYNQRKILKEYFIPVVVGCLAGAATSIFSILGLCRLFEVDKAVAAAMVPKSCTTPIAIAIAEAHGGVAAIAATCVAVAGITGVVCAPLFAKWFSIKDPVAQGLATGACSHALGTTKAREMGELQGAMSSIAIGICGMISVVISLFITV
ncbi:MAG: LrgB family protein [Oscillospiraceae bacterium]|nr:LrgB family protein [Oscillospiraceae bacterium]